MHVVDLDNKPRYINSHFFAFICMDWNGVGILGVSLKGWVGSIWTIILVVFTVWVGRSVRKGNDWVKRVKKEKEEKKKKKKKKKDTRRWVESNHG